MEAAFPEIQKRFGFGMMRLPMIGVIGGEVFALFEVQTVDSVGGIEDTIDLHTVDVEVGLHLVLRQIELCLLHLSGIVEAVIRLKLKIGAHGLAGIGFNGGSTLWASSISYLVLLS